MNKRDCVYTKGRAELLHWVNELLGISYDKIEDLSNGAAFCQVVDAIHPGSVHLGRVNFPAVTEAEMIENYKILQEAFAKNGITQHIDVPTLVKGKYMAALELCQWLYSYYNQMGCVADYDGPSRRRASKCKDIKISDAQKAAKPSKTPRTNKLAAATCVLPNALKVKVPPARGMAPAKPEPPPAELPLASGSDSVEIKRLRKQVSQLGGDVEQRVQERDFYFMKLRKIEEFCQDHEDNSLIKEILDVLYEADEEHGFLPPEED
jgi:RP/EB family microtubule-associated protein